MAHVLGGDVGNVDAAVILATAAAAAVGQGLRRHGSRAGEAVRVPAAVAAAEEAVRVHCKRSASGG